ncbi:MAG: S-layer homology domain-containing protein [Oscillospiraceae bacterium]|nr:S-layer homology domain-containing protein [Oscillospiraceae bacterium]
MKVWKKASGLVLAAAILIGCLILPSAAVADSVPFTDIANAQTAEAAEVLRLLGIVGGVGSGSFQPDGHLTRAAFCKMAVESLGRGSEEAAQRARTIYTDVGPNHWARGYINLASGITLSDGSDTASATRLIMGVGNGTFAPDRDITCGEAVTILMRILGYGSGDIAAGSAWYDGYVSVAAQIGLTDGVTFQGDTPATRGQAAVLFYNLLFTESRGGSDIFLTTLGGKKEDGGILLDTDATASDGTTAALRTTTGTYQTKHAPFDAALAGTQGELVLDKDGYLLTILPKENVSSRAVVATEWAYNYLMTAEQDKLDIPPESAVYQNGEEKTYESLWLSLQAGTALTIYYTSAGKVDYLFLSGAETEDAVMVALRKPTATYNPFAALTGGASDYRLYRNGKPATLSDLCQYDVATWDSAARALQVSDLRLTGIYENAYPNPQTPTTVTVLSTAYPLLDNAAQALESFSLGDQITLLFTAGGDVAAVLPAATVSSTAVGTVTAIDTSGNATVTLLNSILDPISGKVEKSGNTALAMQGELVTVSSKKAGQLILSAPNTSTAKNPVDLTTSTMGNLVLDGNVAVFDRIGKGSPRQVALEDVTLDQIPVKRILYYATNAGGRVSLLLLDNVTGDAYTYGIVSFTPGSSDENPTVSVENADGVLGPLTSTSNLNTTRYAGVAPTTAGDKVAGSVLLIKQGNAARGDFDPDGAAVTVGGVIYPIAKEVQCYNNFSKSWFGSENDDRETRVNAARTFSDSLTLYYDKAPQEGGKIRLIVAE